MTTPIFATLNSIYKTLRSLIDRRPSSFILLPRLCEGKARVYLLEEGGTIVEYSEIKKTPLYLVGLSNGLLCLCSWGGVHTRPRTNSDCSMYISNPVTREYLLLPDIAPSSYRYFFTSSAFGYDHYIKKLKVVVIFQIFPWGQDEPYRTEVCVYTFGSSSWKKINHASDFALPQGEGPGVFLKNSVHWLDTNHRGIISFDIGRENFGVVPMPELYFSSLHKLRIGVIDGCLYLSYFHSSDGVGQFEIWVMKEYNVKESWIKQFVIEKDFMCRRYIEVVFPVCYQKNGEVVLLCDYQFLVSYNDYSRKVTPLVNGELGICGKPLPSFEVFPFDRSLASPHQLTNEEKQP